MLGDGARPLRRQQLRTAHDPYLTKHPQLAANSLIWLELKLLESREQPLVWEGPSGCALISQAEVQELFDDWNRALQSRDPEKVAGLYSRDAVAGRGPGS